MRKNKTVWRDRQMRQKEDCRERDIDETEEESTERESHR
jgi:hypothetical protein